MSSDIVRHQNAEQAAVGLSDVLDFRLSVVFCGLNPALTAVRDGRNFSSPSNRFWKVLHLSGFTPRLLQAEEEQELLQYGCGITAVVSRATRSAIEITTSDYKEAAPLFEAKMRKFAPANLAFLGKAAFAAITSKPDCDWGKQSDFFAGAQTWVLPNPSGLNRAFSLDRLKAHYLQLRAETEPTARHGDL
ncbi:MULTISPECIES: G/U mismatch-specific DNA glycosylase [Rhizobium]|uniref:G/U mismatch-specific uracil-DNA glycosylase n=1 Tax=Rhizobium lusitanum TaxID=293958 RepID=A0A1C3XF31_9HYPH|nr:MULTISPECIES: G/U mismatch-specific DNA glycosylase [Rhizobium]NKJ36427.1 TDG/mug DNA glycosylase family protein [Rhizobium sp. SG570]SCB50867.1 G/U mismatch-specific uracil-DNA glycosylase [Rhizobium lusitanum]